ncbi:MAG: UDP-N-acetylmuramoyl-L-alanyl-D-glutamate--2,6-diaminopimelate ligase [Pseudomonadota bacterium]
MNAVALTDPAERNRLAVLLDGFAETADRPVTDVCADSRAAVPGGLFLALAREPRTRDAHVAEAVARGATVVVHDSALPAPEPCPGGEVLLVPVAELGRRAGIIAGRFWGEPSRALEIVGITGTNGKSTCAWLLAQALEGPAALVGTLGYGPWDRLEPASHTTPDAVALQRLLAQYRDIGMRSVAMEVSSHGLVQERLVGTRVDVAVFTNISRDHLDYHGDMAAYTAAKARLFAQPGLRAAVINADDPAAEQMEAAVPPDCRVLRYGLEQPAVIRLHHRQPHAGGQWLDVVTPWGRLNVDLPLFGAHNAANALAVVGALGAEEMALETMRHRLEGLLPPPGRMERVTVDGVAGPGVVVDYAHTPAALEATLAGLREHAGTARIVCVFGCGGDRDTGKRGPMGAVAENGADRVIITDDNPRHETSASIIEAIRAGMRAPETARVVPDRAEAILTAIADAAQEDWVLIAGKGHETEQQVDDEVQPFDDREVARDALERRRGGLS